MLPRLGVQRGLKCPLVDRNGRKGIGLGGEGGGEKAQGTDFRLKRGTNRDRIAGYTMASRYSRKKFTFWRGDCPKNLEIAL
ncbi:hypothetical protein D3C86_1953860 [compost metagenome]